MSGLPQRLANRLKAAKVEPAPADDGLDALVREALEEIEAALGETLSPASQKFLGAVAAAIAVQGRVARRFDEVLSAAVVDLRGPITSEERQALRAELIRTVAGSLPGADEREALAQRLVQAVRLGLEVAPGGHGGGAGRDEMLKAAGAGARLGALDALSPDRVLRVAGPLAAWLGFAAAGGATFGAALVWALMR